MMNREIFYAYARRAPFGGRISKEQVTGTNAILDAWDRHGDGDDRKLANVLAQVFHETGARMVPVRETFASSDRQAIRRLDAAWRQGRLPQVSKPYWRDGWFGRGPIQVTHEDNYIRMAEALGVDLHGKPGLLLDLEVGALSAVKGMMDGLFSGAKLADFFNGKKDDPVGARRIVNGSDKARLIASYHRNFLDSIKAAREAAPSDVKMIGLADGPKLSKDKATLGGGLLTLGTLGGAATAAQPILEGIANPYAFGAFVLIVILAAVGGYLFLTGRLQSIRRTGV